METIDLIIGLILVIAFFMGFQKGLLRALASLVGLVVAVYCAMFFSEIVEGYLIRWFNMSGDISRLISFLITFFLVLMLFALLGRVLTKVADFAMLGIFNKFLGGFFNVAKIVFLLSVIFMFVNASDQYSILMPEDRDASKLYRPIEAVAPAVLPAIERHIEDFEFEIDVQSERQDNPVLDTLQ